MSLQAVTKTNLAVKARTRDRVGVSSQDLSAAKRIAGFLVSSDQSQDIAKTFVQPQPASTKLPIACARDLPDGRFVETYRLRIGESGTSICKSSQEEGSHQCRSSQTKSKGSCWARRRTYPRKASKIPDRSASLERSVTRSSIAASIGSSSTRARKV